MATARPASSSARRGGLEPGELREGMTLEVRWTDGADRFGQYNLPVFGPPAGR
jgi:hypothetical protein